MEIVDDCGRLTDELHRKDARNLSPDELDLPKYVSTNYTRMFQLDSRPGHQEDFCILIHINKLCVFTLAPSHPVVRLKKTPISVDFLTSEGLDRSQSRGQGYHKKGAHLLVPGSTICSIKCSDDSEYAVRCQFTGKLLEVNAELSKNPAPLLEDPMVTGYIAIIKPNDIEMDSIKTTLCDELSYAKLRFASENINL